MKVLLMMFFLILVSGCVNIVNDAPQVVSTELNESSGQQDKVNIITDDATDSNVSVLNLSTLNMSGIEESDNATDKEKDSCVPTRMTFSRKESEAPTGYHFEYINISGKVYGFAYSDTGNLEVERLKKIRGDIELRLSIPTEAYAPKEAVRIDDYSAVRIISKNKTRIDSLHHNTSFSIDIFELNDCAHISFEKEPIITLNCYSQTGDCIGPASSMYYISVSVFDAESYPDINITLRIDDGPALMPTREPSNLFNTYSSQYDFPAYTFRPANHVLTVTAYTDYGLEYTRNYHLNILPDDQVGVELFSKSEICNSKGESESLRYYDSIDGKDILRHDYYPQNITLSSGECADSGHELTICETGLNYIGSGNVYKIFRLVNAKSYCYYDFNIPDSCYSEEIIEEGDSFTSRYTEYDFIKAYKNPKVLFLYDNERKWYVYYPYDVSSGYYSSMRLNSNNDGSYTVMTQKPSCS